MTISETNFHFTGQTGFYRGKVRDVYYFGDLMAVVATDRISAFDVVLPRAIPGKGQVLNQTAAHFLTATRTVVPNWVLEVPDPNVTVGRVCQPFPIEMVIRGYLAGHAWRTYAAGGRVLCGVPLPEGLRENDPLPEPIITPTTKAHAGHDQDISRAEILAQGLASPDDYAQLEAHTRALFARGSAMARARGLLLVDTKYEFGRADDQIYLIDEVHTPDSSRYFYAEGYGERQQRGEPQQQLSKEFVRQWLIGEGFQGRPGDPMPDMSDTWVDEIARRYRELYERVTGQTWSAPPPGDPLARIEASIGRAFSSLA